MVEKIKDVLKKIKQDKGDVYIFALLKMDELSDRWSLILSAPWAKEDDVDIFKYVLKLVKDNVSAEEFSSIARLGIFPKSEHFIEMLLEHPEGSELKNAKVNGNEIHEGFIIGSTP